MYEILKSQFESGNTFTSKKYQSYIKKEYWAKYFWDMHPLIMEYYHELNPYFLCNIYHPDHFKFAKVITVRDGLLNFASWMLANYMVLPKLGTELYIIHPDLAPIVPSNLSPYFATWSVTRPNPIKLKEAKKVIIFSFMADQYIGNESDLKERMKILKDIPPKAQVELYLPYRKNVFEESNKESIILHQTMNEIKNALPGKELTFLTSSQFFERSSFNETYLVDLARDRFMVSDNYIHYSVMSKGGTVHEYPAQKPKDAVFSLNLSLYHEFHVSPLPKVECLFPDLLFYKIQNQNKAILFDPFFHNLVRNSSV